MFFMRILGCISAVMLALAVTAQDTPTELKIDKTYVPEDCKVKSQNGDRLQVHYVRLLGDVSIGAGQVIKGWEEGLKGMCVGEKRILTIPPSMAYGSRGFGSVIPPNSALVFDVELAGLDAKGPREEL
ncbi:FK506-binding protein 2 [Trametes pubescens]|uniref:peptidylprolyl isomerase n=1 Tax=Trametes pubescens TaxID=154538 RepID=A0A1M2VII2_TRAPU|nr:FK506-binding protein 2 [Trametes pubescens]